VIYLGLRQTPEMIVSAAVQEDVDAIGISILSGAHMTVFPRILEQMKNNKVDDVLLFGGGIIPDADYKKLKELGVRELFTPGASTKEVVSFLNKWVEENPRSLV
ncbi:MAG: cobalamin-dependent protein, partial [Ignavibacteriae bacterium]|nr:cobalamin-dependent protein [Ignavibacteriota bacterium]